MPFPELQGDPAERVAKEAPGVRDKLQGSKATFSSALMTHNTRVSILALALGMTWGLALSSCLQWCDPRRGGPDYVQAGQTTFAWVASPHGAFEIPAILIAGQQGYARKRFDWLGERTLEGASERDLDRSGDTDLAALF